MLTKLIFYSSPKVLDRRYEGWDCLGIWWLAQESMLLRDGKMGRAIWVGLWPASKKRGVGSVFQPADPL